MHHWLEDRIPGQSRFGRRTLVLLHCGSTWIIFGWAIYSIPVERFSRPGPGGALEIMDTPWPGIMWAACGVLAIINAVFRKRWHGRDVMGFTGIVTPPFVWLLAYMWSAIAYVVTHGDSGNPRAGVGLVTWYLVSAFVLIIAGWPDPDDPAITRVDPVVDPTPERQP